MVNDQFSVKAQMGEHLTVNNQMKLHFPVNKYSKEGRLG